MLGIAARNGIMLISHYQHLEREEGVPFGPGLVAPGREGAARADPDDRAGDRARPRAARCWRATSPGHEIEYPMAIVILGGLVTSTLLNLFVVPSLYLFLGKSRKEKRELGMAAG